MQCTRCRVHAHAAYMQGYRVHAHAHAHAHAHVTCHMSHAHAQYAHAGYIHMQGICTCTSHMQGICTCRGYAAYLPRDRKAGATVACLDGYGEQRTRGAPRGLVRVRARVRARARVGVGVRVRGSGLGLAVQPGALSVEPSKRASLAQSAMLTARLVAAQRPAMPRPRGSVKRAPPSSSDRQKTSLRCAWRG